MAYSVNGRTVELDASRSPIHLDANGLPIHGLVTASPFWRVVGRSPGNGQAAIAARLDYAAHEELMSGFPFPARAAHPGRAAGRHADRRTIVLSTGDVPVPVAFGWHPYLRLPGVPRAEWVVELPVRVRAAARRARTAHRRDRARRRSSRAARSVTAPTTTTSSELERPACSRSRAAGEDRGRVRRRLPVAQVFAPPERRRAYVCFEPMTAPVTRSSAATGSRSVPPGGSFRADFTVRVT